jgi:hypothetical protein
MEKAAVDAEAARLARAHKAFEDRAFTVRLDLVRLPEQLRRAEADAAHIRADLQTRVDTSGERFRIVLEGREFTVRSEAAACLRRLLIEHVHTSPVRQVLPLGHFAGFALEAAVQRGFPPELVLRGQHEHVARVHLEETTAGGNLQTLEGLPRRMEATLAKAEESAAHLRQQLAELQALAGTHWEHQTELERLLARQRELDALLSEQPEDRRTDLAGLEVAEAELEAEAAEMTYSSRPQRDPTARRRGTGQPCAGAVQTHSRSGGAG